MSSTEDRWRQKMKFRGFRILGFTIPIFVTSLIASSQMPKAAPTHLYSSKSHKTPRAKDSLSLRFKSQTAKLTYSIMLNNKRRSLSQYKLKYNLKDQDGHTIRGESLKGSITKATESPILIHSKEILLGNEASFTLDTNIYGKQLPIKSWQVSLNKQASGKPTNLLITLDMMFWPCLSIMAIGTAILMFPYFV